MFWKIRKGSHNKYLIMKLPLIHGNLVQSNYFIYTACDTQYFEEFGAVLINSIKTNTRLGIHIHLFNPTQDQINYCINQNVGITYENISLDSFVNAAKRWEHPVDSLATSHLDRTLTAMRKGRDKDLLQRMQKTYYACARFIRLAELYTCNFPVLSIDVDAVVRSSPAELQDQKDFYVHQITGKKARILAGGMYIRPVKSAQQFLNQYAEALTKFLSDDYIYWGLDQDVLDNIVPNFNYGQLPSSYIDWNMNSNSCIWTAKGTRKDSPVFINEQLKYKI
jgi:hypothetical protein